MIITIHHFLTLFVPSMLAPLVSSLSTTSELPARQAIIKGVIAWPYSNNEFTMYKILLMKKVIIFKIILRVEKQNNVIRYYKHNHLCEFAYSYNHEVNFKYINSLTKTSYSYSMFAHSSNNLSTSSISPRPAASYNL